MERLPPWRFGEREVSLSLPLLPGPLWPGVVVPDRVLSMGQIEQTMCKQIIDVKLWPLYSNTNTPGKGMNPIILPPAMGK